jgi:hypothetical protein
MEKIVSQQHLQSTAQIHLKYSKAANRIEFNDVIFSLCVMKYNANLNRGYLESKTKSQISRIGLPYRVHVCFVTANAVFYLVTVISIILYQMLMS